MLRRPSPRASRARVAPALEGDADLADVADVAQLGHGKAHPRGAEFADDDAADVLGQGFEELELPARELGHDALDHLAVVDGVVDVVRPADVGAGDADLDFHLERLGALLFPLVDAHPRVDPELADEYRIHGSL